LRGGGKEHIWGQLQGYVAYHKMTVKMALLDVGN